AHLVVCECFKLVSCDVRSAVNLHSRA
ncbi:hypothetical protein D018_3392, partial [Vibrio parahaemolyticus VP2007-007]